MEHYHVWVLESLRQAGNAVTALVLLSNRFEYRNAAVRSAPPGSRCRVFKCRDHCKEG